MKLQKPHCRGAIPVVSRWGLRASIAVVLIVALGCGGFIAGWTILRRYSECLILGLDSDDDDVRIARRQALVAMWSVSLPVLTDASVDSDYSVRERIGALGTAYEILKLAEKRVCEAALASIQENEDPKLGYWAAHTLNEQARSGIDGEVAAVLAKRWQCELHPSVRHEIAVYLACTGDASHTNLLHKEHTTTEDKQVRLVSAVALYRLTENREYIEEIEEAASSADPGTRRLVISTVGEIWARSAWNNDRIVHLLRTALNESVTQDIAAFHLDQRGMGKRHRHGAALNSDGGEDAGGKDPVTRDGE